MVQALELKLGKGVVVQTSGFLLWWACACGADSWCSSGPVTSQVLWKASPCHLRVAGTRFIGQHTYTFWGGHNLHTITCNHSEHPDWVLKSVCACLSTITTIRRGRPSHPEAPGAPGCQYSQGRADCLPSSLVSLLKFISRLVRHYFVFTLCCFELTHVAACGCMWL